uniref:Sp1 transcription factor n=1 Tax=Myripristis murdjan TaxID=586833 RepID=A0A667W8A3_9TELE
MLCILWVIFQTLAFVVEGGVTSASGEAAGNGGVNNNGGTTGNNANPGAQTGVPLNGDAFVAQVVPVGGSFFIQPVGNPIGQAPVQQLIPTAPLQQGGAFFLGQTRGVNGISQPQGQVTQSTHGGPVTFFAVLPQGNAIGSPQSPILIPGQLRLIPVNGQINQQQPAAVGNASVTGLIPPSARGCKSPSYTSINTSWGKTQNNNLLLGCSSKLEL